jgi:hypothetical protein
MFLTALNLVRLMLKRFPWCLLRHALGWPALGRKNLFCTLDCRRAHVHAVLRHFDACRRGDFDRPCLCMMQHNCYDSIGLPSNQPSGVVLHNIHCCSARRILSDFVAAPWWAQSMHLLLAFFEKVVCGRALVVYT